VLPGSPPPATAVAVGDYPLDHHRRFDASAPAIRFPAITAFSVPYGTLVPAGCDGVLVAEKSIGVSGLVNGCTRLQPVVMQIGQAAGAAAAICARGAIDPRNVDPEALQDTLLDANGLLVAASDVRCGDPGFRALQRAAVDGWLELRHVSGGWANRARLDPDEPVTRRTVAACRERTHARPGGRPGHDRLHRALEDAERAITEGGSVTRRELAVRVMAARSG